MPRLEKAAARKRRSEVLDELLDVLTKPRQDQFSEPLLRAALISQAVKLDDLAVEAAARGAAVSSDLRSEALLSLAVLALQKLLTD
jgi:hypothetical protein